MKRLLKQIRASEDGQAAVVIMLAMVGLLAFLGLVTDVGWGMYQHRNAQNAADAAVLAAIQEIANSATGCADATLRSSVDSLITTYVGHNGGSNATWERRFISNTGSTVGAGIACTATGIEVTVTVPYNNFFLNIIGIASSLTKGKAAGRVRVLNGNTTGPPFVVCGVSTVRTSDKTVWDIIDTTNNPPSVDESFVGWEFDIHGEDVGQNGGDCGLGSDFKGNADDDQVGCLSMPCTYETQNGTRTGPTTVRVAGALPGCDVTSGGDVDACVLILPLADGRAASCGGGSCTTTNAVTWAAFYVTKIDTNSHTGTLLGNVFTQGPSADWTPGASGPLVLALTE